MRCLERIKDIPNGGLVVISTMVEVKNLNGTKSK